MTRSDGGRGAVGEGRGVRSICGSFFRDLRMSILGMEVAGEDLLSVVLLGGGVGFGFGVGCFVGLHLVQ